MRNIIAIADRELRSYFSSPIAYILIGFFLLPFGVFFYLYLRCVREAEHADGAVRRRIDEHQPAGDPLRAAERVGDHPVHHADDHDAHLLGGEAFRHNRAAADLSGQRTSRSSSASSSGRWDSTSRCWSVTLLYMGDPVLLRQPRVAAAGRRISRSAADGRRLHRLGLLISSTTNNQIVAGVVTFVVFLLFWIVGWFADSRGPDDRTDHAVAVDHRALRRFLEGHHRHQARALLPEPHHVRPLPDGQVGRHGKVARLSHAEAYSRTPRLARRRARLRGGGDPLPQAGIPAVLQRAGDRRSRLHAALHAQPVARDRTGVLGTAGALRHAGRGEHRSSCSASSVAINYLSTKYNKRWDLTVERSQFSLSDQTKKVLQDLKEPINVRVFARSEEFQRFRDRLDEYTYQTKQLNDRVHRSGEAARRRAAVRRDAARHDCVRLQGTQREGHVRQRAGADQRADQGDPGPSAEDATSRRATASTTRPAPTRQATTPLRPP